MEPAFYRGDILFINWDYTPPTPGDIVVFKIPNQEIPIVHRVIALQHLLVFYNLAKMVILMHLPKEMPTQSMTEACMRTDNYG